MIRFNNSQRLGLDLDRHIALDAGAGTGKEPVMPDAGLQDARADADGRRPPCCVPRWTKVHWQSEARYTFGVANKPEVLEVYPHKTSFRGWAYTFPELAD